LRPYLPTRTLRGGEKLVQFPSTTAFKTLSDIRHDRYGSALDLPSEPEIFGKSPSPGTLINCSRRLPGFLPGD
jgi:hypothetical protein